VLYTHLPSPGPGAGQPAQPPVEALQLLLCFLQPRPGGCQLLLQLHRLPPLLGSLSSQFRSLLLCGATNPEHLLVSCRRGSPTYGCHATRSPAPALNQIRHGLRHWCGAGTHASVLMGCLVATPAAQAGSTLRARSALQPPPSPSALNLEPNFSPASASLSSGITC
jgi:hypothetical protein